MDDGRTSAMSRVAEVGSKAGPWRVAFTGLALLAAGDAGQARACPVCNTETGAAVRDGIFDGRFLGTLAGTLSPFPVLLLVALALRGGWRPLRFWRRRRARANEVPAAVTMEAPAR
jgi:hypothetical protein